MCHVTCCIDDVINVHAINDVCYDVMFPVLRTYPIVCLSVRVCVAMETSSLLRLQQG